MDRKILDVNMIPSSSQIGKQVLELGPPLM